ncbi:MAG: hypothetical protein FJZ10_04665 [Candidatus Omnitrophica bacterium]|nr:hypothetical protein [Candidatus Omnitrophota bacterium]
MNVIKVIIENWPKKELLIEWFPLIISLSALIVSLIFNYIMWKQTIKEFALSYRPYVYIVSITKEPENVLILCKNRPAEIVKETSTYYAVTVDNKGQKKEVLISANDKALESTEKYVVYPDDRAAEIWKIGFDFSKEIAKPETKEILRKVRIEYKELSSKRKYFFEVTWRFNKQTVDWDVLKQIGN